MQITIGAQCWDGARRKTLRNEVNVSSAKFPSDCEFESNRWGELARRLKHPGVKSVLGFTVPLVLLASGFPPIGLASAFAAAVQPEAAPAMAIGDGAKEAILHAFDPLINLIQSLAYPIAGVMIAGGCLFVMVGNRERGMSMLQNAAIGYILVQLSPLFLKLLVGIGASV